MAQRGAWTPQKVRDRIQVSMLITRLTNHALGRNKMTSTQMRAIEVLLKKALPDLVAVDTTVRGDPNAPLIISTTDGKL
jgi:hypothetical protein